MNFNGMYFDNSIFILIPAILISIWASSRVKTTYAKFAKIGSRAGYTGVDMARKILDDNDLSHVGVEHAKGKGLSDHYDPKAQVLRLSQGVYSSTSIAALSIAAHEAGHAIQHDMNYVPLKVRNAIIPVVNFGSKTAFPLIILGLILSFSKLVMFGIICYCFAIVFHLITLPVEFNASSKAIGILKERGYLTNEEIPMAKKVLSAAAMTYVAAALTAALQLIRLLMISRRRN